MFLGVSLAVDLRVFFLCRPSQDLREGGGGLRGAPPGSRGEPGALREDGGEHGEDEAAPARGAGEHLDALRRLDRGEDLILCDRC